DAEACARVRRRSRRRSLGPFTLARAATRPCSACGLLAQPACVVARRARSWALRGTRGRWGPRSQSVSAAECAEPRPLPAGTPLASNGELRRSTLRHAAVCASDLRRFGLAAGGGRAGAARRRGAVVRAFLERVGGYLPRSSRRDASSAGSTTGA